LATTSAMQSLGCAWREHTSLDTSGSASTPRSEPGQGAIAQDALRLCRRAKAICRRRMRSRKGQHICPSIHSEVSCMTSEDLTKSMQVSRRRGREEQEGRLSVRSTVLNELRAMLPPRTERGDVNGGDICPDTR
jgi:hypothetical protein